MKTPWIQLIRGSMMKSRDTYCKVDGCQEADFTSSLYVVHKTVQWCGPGHGDRTTLTSTEIKLMTLTYTSPTPPPLHLLLSICIPRLSTLGYTGLPFVTFSQQTYFTETKLRMPELVYFFFFFFSSGLTKFRLYTCPPLPCKVREGREGK